MPWFTLHRLILSVILLAECCIVMSDGLQGLEFCTGELPPNLDSARRKFHFFFDQSWVHSSWQAHVYLILRSLCVVCG